MNTLLPQLAGGRLDQGTRRERRSRPCATPGHTAPCGATGDLNVGSTALLGQHSGPDSEDPVQVREEVLRIGRQRFSRGLTKSAAAEHAACLSRADRNDDEIDGAEARSRLLERTGDVILAAGISHDSERAGHLLLDPCDALLTSSGRCDIPPLLRQVSRNRATQIAGPENQERRHGTHRNDPRGSDIANAVNDERSRHDERCRAKEPR